MQFNNRLKISCKGKCRREDKSLKRKKKDQKKRSRDSTRINKKEKNNIKPNLMIKKLQ